MTDYVLVFNYPDGSASAKERQELNAKKIKGLDACVRARSVKDDWPAVEQIDRAHLPELTSPTPVKMN